MAVARRTSAAYASLIAVTPIQNTTPRENKNSRCSIGWYERDENIINGSKQNPFTEYSGNSNTSKDISELPKILIEQSPDINQTLYSEMPDVQQMQPDVYNNCDEGIIDNVVSATEVQSSVTRRSQDETPCTVYENPLSDELQVIKNSHSNTSVDLFSDRRKKKGMTRRWTISNLNFDRRDYNKRINTNEIMHCPTNANESNNSKGMKINEHYLLPQNFESKEHSLDYKNEHSSECLKRLCSLQDHHISKVSEPYDAIPMNEDCVYDQDIQYSEIDSFIDMNGCEGIENARRCHNKDYLKMNLFQNLTTIQTISENSDSPSKTQVIQNKSLPDIGILEYYFTKFNHKILKFI